MLLSEILYNLFVDKNIFLKNIEDSDDIEVSKLHNFYFLNKGYSKIKEHLKNGTDFKINIIHIKTKFDNDFVDINNLPHHNTDKPKWQKEH